MDLFLRRSIFCGLCFFCILVYFPNIKLMIEESLNIELSTLETTFAITAEADQNASFKRLQQNETQNGYFSSSHDKRRCHISIENKYDYHYEILESTALMYPLPWDEMDCVNDDQHPAIFDFYPVFALGWSGEILGWEKYYNASMRNQIVRRTDGRLIQYGEAVYHRWGSKVGKAYYESYYHVRIGTSCDSDTSFKRWIPENKFNFCVMHGRVPLSVPQHILKKCCALTPMNPIRHPCYYLPTALPKFPRPLPPNPILRLCLLGGSEKNHTLLADALWKLQPKNIELHVLGRYKRKKKSQITLKYKSTVPIVFMDHNVSQSYLDYQGHVAGCHAAVNLIVPGEKLKYYPEGGKKLSGSISQIISYMLPTVLEERLFRIYEKHFKADHIVEIFQESTEEPRNSSTQFFEPALEKLLQRVRGTAT